MSIPLDLKYLSSKDALEIRKYTVSEKKTHYNKFPRTYRVYHTNAKDNECHVPIGTWKDHFDEFPTPVSEFKQTNLPLNSTLYTPKTDPENRGRDQEYIVTNALKQLTTSHSSLISASTGYGKCFGRGVKIITNKGVKRVEDIKVGDVLMDENENKTTVSNITNGYEEMYRIKIGPREYFTCNKSHILTLYKVTNNITDLSTSFKSKFDANKIVDVTLSDYLKMNNSTRSMYKVLHRAHVKRPLKKRWTEPNMAFIIAIRENRMPDISLMDDVQTYSPPIRTAILNRILDHIGTKEIKIKGKQGQYNVYHITHNSKKFLRNIIKIARSLGYIAVHSIQSPLSITIIYIKRLFHYLYTPTVESISDGRYYGFTLDGSRRFVTDSYMVAHNTRMGVHLAIKLNVPTAIICHFETVRNQWIPTINELTNGKAKIQVIKGNKPIDKTADFYIIGIGKASNLDRKTLFRIGTVIIDEVHICTIKAFTDTLFNFEPCYLLMLSATPDRKDGMDKIFKYYCPEKFICKSEQRNFTVHKVKTLFEPTIEYIENGGRMIPNWSVIKKSIEENEERWVEISEIVLRYKELNFIILCDRVAQTWGIYYTLVGMIGEEKVSILVGSGPDGKKSPVIYDDTKQYKCVSMKKGGVGMDNKFANAVVLASDVTDPRQYVGRVRKNNGHVFDIVDSYRSFENHYKKRATWYRKEGYEILEEKGYETPKETIQAPIQILEW